MNTLATLRISVRALLRNKLRSFLTALGIIIGVAAVIAMVAIGEGAKAQVQKQFSMMGTNLLVIQSGSSRAGGVRGGFGSQPTLTYDDLKAIQNEIPSVRLAAPELRSNAQLLSEDQNWNAPVIGTTPEYLTIRNWEVELGSPFSQSEVDTSAKVALLGQTVVTNLFGANADPIGMSIRINQTPFVVVGVLKSKGQSSSGQDFDNVVLVPVSSYRTKIARTNLQQFIQGSIYVNAISEEATAKAQREVSNLLRDRHHIGSDTDDDFQIRNLAELANAREASTQTMTTLLAAIAAVSLLVGGIGIMNIMLVSVTERTREIGLRMAVGATPGDILAQFLVEALTLSLTGGILGVAIGVGTAEWLAKSFSWPLLIRPDIVAVSVGFSALVGVVFGLYPARKASQLDPIQALRYE